VAVRLRDCEAAREAARLQAAREAARLRVYEATRNCEYAGVMAGRLPSAVGYSRAHGSV